MCLCWDFLLRIVRFVLVKIMIVQFHLNSSIYFQNIALIVEKFNHDSFLVVHSTIMRRNLSKFIDVTKTMVLWFYSNCSILNLAADEWRACQIAAVTQYKLCTQGFSLKRKNNLESKIINKNKNLNKCLFIWLSKWSDAFDISYNFIQNHYIKSTYYICLLRSQKCNLSAWHFLFVLAKINFCQ